MHTFSDELDSALSCDEFSVATMTTQCFENHGIECDFYSLMPLHGESLKEQSCDTRLCDPSCHSTLQMPTQDHGEDFTSGARSCLTPTSHGEDFMSGARSCLTPTSEVWLLNENTSQEYFRFTQKTIICCYFSRSHFRLESAIMFNRSA